MSDKVDGLQVTDGLGIYMIGEWPYGKVPTVKALISFLKMLPEDATLDLSLPGDSELVGIEYTKISNEVKLKCYTTYDGE